MSAVDRQLALNISGFLTMISTGKIPAPEHARKEAEALLDGIGSALAGEEIAATPLWRHAITECSEAHLVLDGLAVPTVERRRRVRGPDGVQEVTIGLAARIRTGILRERRKEEARVLRRCAEEIENRLRNQVEVENIPRDLIAWYRAQADNIEGVTHERTDRAEDRRS